ncbi:MAG: hypothetical protein F9K40_23845 [Kofleriaceae bacterium]|nr:MAG: hypothetical protein F9K40_23845 [Kofleriaceae bacterium]MBZ0236652.1 hypothetical protein [Kofleriaceae bacterium]
MRAVPLILATGVSAACATYRAGSFEMSGEPMLGERTTAGCLDLAVDVARDAVATGPVVQYQFGNRCDRAATIDLGGVRVTGRTATGEEVAMVPYDPYNEIRALALDARASGRERIEYRTSRELSGDVVAVCVAIGAIGGDAVPAAPLHTTCKDVVPPSAVAAAEVSP